MWNWDRWELVCLSAGHASRFVVRSVRGSEVKFASLFESGASVMSS